MIPDRLKLMGVPIRIETGDATRWRRQLPETRYSGDRLVIDETITSPVLRELAFVKELTSCILYTVGADELVKDNRTLGLFSRLMHQALQGIIQSSQTRQTIATSPADELSQLYWEQMLADFEQLALKETAPSLEPYLHNPFDGHQTAAPAVGDCDDEDPFDFSDLDGSAVCEETDCESFWDEYFRAEEPETWIDYADSLERSNNEGWFYED